MNHFKKVKEYLPDPILFAQTAADETSPEPDYIMAKLAKTTITPVVVCDLDHKITYVNKAFTRLTGYTLQETAGFTQAELLSGVKNYDIHLQDIYKKLLQGSSYQLQFLCKTKFGEQFWNDLFITPILDDDGSLARYFTTYRDITESIKLENALKSAQEERERRVTEQVILAQERERTLISRELHDNVNQVLTAVKLQLETASDNGTPPQETLQRCIGFLNNSIDEIRKLSKMLSAPTLGSATLADCINDLCAELDKLHQLEIVVEANDYVKRLPTDKELALYRIFQEQLDNVIQHANATKVRVILRQHKNKVLFSVEDNGKGFNPKASREGLGINNIMSRVKVLRGTLEIETAPGKGCKMEINFTV